MVPPLLFDISQIDMNQQVGGIAEIEAVNPHRGDMRLLDGMIWMDLSLVRAVAFKDVRHNEFWVPGHIPGRPLFPGVLMIEAGAQLASFVTLTQHPEMNFIGFGGVDRVKFRGQVVPGDRLILLGEQIEFRRRRITCNIQGLVNGSVVFEARIIGMPM